MKNILKLKAERAKALEAMKALSAKAAGEARDFEEAEQAEFEALEKRHEDLGKAIAREERLAGIEPEADTDVENFEDEEPEVRSAGARGKGKPVGPFRSLGEQMLAIRSAAMNPNAMDKRLIDPALRSNELRNLGILDVRSPAGMGELIDSDGGFLVQHDFTTELLTLAFAEANLFSKTSPVIIGPGKNGLTWNMVKETSRATGSRHGGVRVYWAAEAATKDASKIELTQGRLGLEKLLAFCYATDENLEDASALESLIREEFPAEMAFVLNDGVLNGTGVGQMLGVLASNALVTVAKESGQAAATIKYENVLKMFARLNPNSVTRAAWYINQACIPQLGTMSLAVGTGGVPVYMPANGAAGQMFSTLFGLPVIPCEQCAALGTVGDIVLADLSQYRTIRKGEIKAAVSMHVKFLTEEQCFRFSYRVNGAPKRNHVLTPYKGSDTIGHFVALATRS